MIHAAATYFKPVTLIGENERIERRQCCRDYIKTAATANKPFFLYAASTGAALASAR